MIQGTESSAAPVGAPQGAKQLYGESEKDRPIQSIGLIYMTIVCRRASDGPTVLAFELSIHDRTGSLQGGAPAPSRPNDELCYPNRCNPFHPLRLNETECLLLECSLELGLQLFLGRVLRQVQLRKQIRRQGSIFVSTRPTLAGDRKQVVCK